MYGEDERSMYKCGKLRTEGAFVWSMTRALIQRVYSNLWLQEMHTSVPKLVCIYNRLQHVSAHYVANFRGRKYKDEIH